MKNGHTKVFAGPKQICKKYRVQPITLRRWADRGKIEYTVTPTGRYLYNISQVEQAFGQEETQREDLLRPSLLPKTKGGSAKTG